MNRVPIKVIASLATLLLCGLPIFNPPALAGPYGIDVENFTPEKYQCEKSDDNSYSCKDIPEPSPEILGYIFVYADKVGLCEITALSKTIYPKQDGANIRAAADRLAAALEAEYGAEAAEKHTPQDYGPISDDENWLAEFLDQRASYDYHWRLDKAPGGIETVLLFLLPIKQAAFISVNYFTAKRDQCQGL